MMGTGMGQRPGSRAGDAWGGFAAMLVALPSAIGYGLYAFKSLPGQEGRAALAGILGAVALGLVAPVFGGSRQLISAPCGPAAAVLASFASESIRGGMAPDKVLTCIGVIGVLAAVLQFAYGAIGGGRLIKYIPYPVVAGYLSGVGIVLFTGYVPKLLGLPEGMNGWAGLLLPSSWVVPGLVVGLVTIAGMVLGQRLTTKAPPVVVGAGAGFLTYAVLGAFHPALRSLEGNHLVLGASASAADLAASFGDRWSAMSRLGAADFQPILVQAITLSVLLSIDTLKTCVIVDALTLHRHDSNRELRGQGFGNFASGVAGGMPGAGTMGATMVNINSGGRTRMSGMLEGVFALLAFALFGGLIPGMPNLIAWFPKAALAGIIMVVSFRMVDRHSLDLLKHRSTVLDFLVILAVIVTAVGVSLIAASGVGLALAIMLFLREQIRGSVVRLKIPGNRVSSKRSRTAAQAAVLQEIGSQATLCELQGPLFFGTTDQLFTILEEDIKDARFLILDLRRVQSVDFTAAHMLEQIEATFTERGAFLVLASIPPTLPTGKDLRAYFDQLGLVKKDRNVRIFDEADDAIEWVEDRILDEAGLGEDVSAPPLALGEFELFKELPEGSLGFLAEVIEERSVKAGEAVFRGGDIGDHLYLIRRGRVEIHLPLEGGRRRHLATYSRQGFFGDMAFLDRGVRSADAVAAKETDLYALSRAKFDALSHRHPSLGAVYFARLARLLSQRLRRTDAELQALEES
jgi:SulP family sulfate permease